jgi:hypothetical protein
MDGNHFSHPITMTYPIVIPLHHAGGKLKDNTELRYALRSLETHFKDEFKTVIVGHALPDWMQNAELIESKQGLKTALLDAAKAYPDGFFWWYDDLTLLKDITAEEMKVTPAMNRWATAQTGWAKSLEKIRERLVAEGRPAHDYSRPHGPYWFDKGMVDEGFKDWPGMKSKFPWESWILSKRDWPRRYGVVKQYYGAFNGAPGDHSVFLNYNDVGNTPELRAWLEKRFPKPSRFEKGEAAKVRFKIKGEEDGPVYRGQEVVRACGGCGSKKPEHQSLITPEVRGVVLRLKSSPRWEFSCQRDCAAVGIKVDFFDGVDAQVDPVEVQVDAAQFRNYSRRKIRNGEIGCFASHVAIGKAAPSLPPLHPTLPHWRLVLEDDAVPAGGMSAEKLVEIAKLADAAGHQFVMVHGGRKSRRAKLPETYLTEDREAGTYAYLATVDALAIVAGWSKMSRPIDTALKLAPEIKMAVLWGKPRFTHRPPYSSTRSIHRERHNRVIADPLLSPESRTLEFFKGKRVAVIGNAPHALKNTEIVEDYDIIIRFNRFQTGDQFSAIGSRTDVIALPLECGGMLTPELANHSPRLILDASLSNPPLAKLSKLRTITPAPVIKIPNAFHCKLAEELGGVRATTGLATLAWIMEHGGAEKIYITGFSFEKTPQDHYFKDSFGYNYSRHCPVKELHWLAKNLSGSPLSGDEHIQRKLYAGQPSDEVAEDRRRKGKPYSVVHRSIYETIAPKVGSLKVLEVGGGIGWGADLMKTHGANITIVEPHPKSSAHLRNAGWKVLSNVSEAESYAFDAATCVEVIEHLPAVEVHAFLCALRQKAPRLFLSTPDRRKSSHGRRTKLEWCNALRLAGWRVVHASLRDWSLYIEANSECGATAEGMPSQRVTLELPSLRTPTSMTSTLIDRSLIIQTPWNDFSVTHIPVAMHTRNLGDDVQSLAASQLWMVRQYVDRDSPSSWPKGVVVPLCGWFGYGNFPSPAEVKVVGFHCQPKSRKNLSDNKAWLAEAVRKQGFPAMCRDIETRDFVRSLGIDAEFGGCVTLTLLKFEGVRSGLVSVDAHPIANGYRRITHRRPPLEKMTPEQRLEMAARAIDLYAKSEHVRTSRLHVFLPCIALGTPVELLIDKAPEKGRFSGYL